MSLKVWLPLNGDLKNKGLSNFIFTNNGATIDNNGKIGKCYSFDGVNDYISGNYFLNGLSEFTISFWHYSTTTTLDFIFLYRGAGAHRLKISNNQFAFRDTTHSNQYYVDFSALEANTWTHITAVYDKGSVYLYKNGILDNSYINSTNSKMLNDLNEFRIGRIESSSGNSYFTGKLNDFRIYDHALSVNEIKELSKGLIVHYKLDSSNKGCDNILTNSTGYNGITDWSGVISVSTENGHPFLIARRTNATSTSRTFVIHSAITSFVSDWETGTEFTISGYYKVPSSEDYNVVANMFIRWGASTSTSDTGFYTPASSSVIKDKWIRFEYTYLVPSYTSGNAVTFYLSAFKKGLSTVYWKDIKLEKGNKATIWSPNSNDILYKTLGYDNNKIVDSSGYGYNGIKNGALAVSTDTLRNSTSAIFNGTNSYIEAEPLPLETKTISIWLKTSWSKPSSGYRLAVHDKNTGLAIGFSYSGMFITYVGSGNGGLGSQIAISSMNYVANQWNHIVIVKTGDITRDVYVNGIKITPSGSNYWGGDLNKLNIGCRHISGSYSSYFNGQMSDFRAYATALSADDIKELYQVGAKIDKSGKMYGYELKED